MSWDPLPRLEISERAMGQERGVRGGVLPALGFVGKESHSANGVITALCEASSFWHRNEMAMVSPHPTPTSSRLSTTPHPLQGQKAGGRGRRVQREAWRPGGPRGNRAAGDPQVWASGRSTPPTEVSPEKTLLCVPGWPPESEAQHPMLGTNSSLPNKRQSPGGGAGGASSPS